MAASAEEARGISLGAACGVRRWGSTKGRAGTVGAKGRELLLMDGVDCAGVARLREGFREGVRDFFEGIALLFGSHTGYWVFFMKDEMWIEISMRAASSGGAGTLVGTCVVDCLVGGQKSPNGCSSNDANDCADCGSFAAADAEEDTASLLN